MKKPATILTVQQLLDAIVGAIYYERYEYRILAALAALPDPKPSIEELQAAELLVRVRRGDFWYYRRGDVSEIKGKEWREILSEKIPGYEQH